MSVMDMTCVVTVIMCVCLIISPPGSSSSNTLHAVLKIVCASMLQ